jgi:hypothetical protein
MKTLACQRDKSELLERVGRLHAGAAARWGRMSVHQMVCHLSDSCRMAIGQRVVAGQPNLMQRTMAKWIALYLPLPWPAGFVTMPEIDQEIAGTRPSEFAADLSQLVALLELTTQPGAFHSRRHPIFGPMSEREWLRWGYLHADHHLRQFGV